MTGQQMVLGVREMLHDSGRGLSTSDRFYTTVQILKSINEAKERVSKSLLDAPAPAFVAANGQAQYVTGGSGSIPVPASFKALMGAVAADGSFIPPIPPTLSPLQGVGDQFIYAEAGSIEAPVALALYGYWQVAGTKITNSAATLTEFSDSVYYTIQLLAARELLRQDKADAVDRWKQMSGMLSEELQTYA